MSGDSSAASGRRLAEINSMIVECRLCPRLVVWREEAAQRPPARFAGEHYWARPVPGFGDPGARVLIVGLAPAAHGGNRTGRIFTGDRSGDFLFAALHRAGFANQQTSIAVNDGLTLTGLYVAAVNRCAPPVNRPTPTERDNCLPYLAAEIAALPWLRAIVCLGAYAGTARSGRWQRTATGSGRDRPSGIALRRPSGHSCWSVRSTPASRTLSPAD